MALKDDMTQLNNIHDLLEDSRKGYTEAAERAEAGHVKELLRHLSTTRTSLIEAVAALRRKADPEATPRAGGRLKASSHRAWMDLRDALIRSANANVLSECERGEEFLLMRYDEVVEKEVAPETYALAQSQRAVVQGNLERIKDLRKRFEHVEH